MSPDQRQHRTSSFGYAGERIIVDGSPRHSISGIEAKEKAPEFTPQIKPEFWAKLDRHRQKANAAINEYFDCLEDSGFPDDTRLEFGAEAEPFVLVEDDLPTAAERQDQADKTKKALHAATRAMWGFKLVFDDLTEPDVHVEPPSEETSLGNFGGMWRNLMSLAPERVASTVSNIQSMAENVTLAITPGSDAVDAYDLKRAKERVAEVTELVEEDNLAMLGRKAALIQPFRQGGMLNHRRLDLQDGIGVEESKPPRARETAAP